MENPQDYHSSDSNLICSSLPAATSSSPLTRVDYPNLTDLDICLAKCTNTLTPISEELIDELCAVANSQINGPYTTLRFLAYKIQSPQELEALHSLRTLEMVVQRGGYKFADEIGKFRFLNEIIKIVSPKYLAHQTSAKVSQRIIELMFQWSVEFKELPKVFEAYQMMKVQKIVVEDPIHVLKNYRPQTPPKPRPKDEIFDDEETVKTLRSLIESGRTENFEAANRMIKSLAVKAESRVQFKNNFNSELESARNCLQLLNEMVAQCNRNVKIDYDKNRILFKGTTQEDIQLMRELLNTCESSHFRLYGLSKQITDNDQQELSNFIEVSNMLVATISSCRLYFQLLDDPKKFLQRNRLLLTISTKTSPDINQDDDQQKIVNAVPNKRNINTIPKQIYNNEDDGQHDHHEERLLDLNTTPISSPINSKRYDQLDRMGIIENELNDQIGSISLIGANQDILPSIDFLTISSSTSSSAIENDFNQRKTHQREKTFKSHYKKQLKPTNKNNSTNDDDGDLNELNAMFNIHQCLNDEYKMKCSTKNNQTNVVNRSNIVHKESIVFDLLSMINIPYEDIKPSKQMRAPLLVFNQNGLMVNLHFTGNSPHRQISVFLLTFTNYSQTNAISNIQFFVSVPKKMKVKLLYKTDSSTLSPVPKGQNFPPKFISQIMLIACEDCPLTNGTSTNEPINNQSKQLITGTKTNSQMEFKLKYKLKYCLEMLNDGQQRKEQCEHCSQLLWYWDLDFNQ